MTSTSITTPCIIDGMDDQTYHSDPVEGGSLSSTGAKAILRSPAHYKWQIDNRIDKSTFDLGHAVHSMVLGVGLNIVAIPESVLSSNGSTGTNAAKEFIAEARANNQVPLKADVIAECQAMSESILAHPIARTLFERAAKAEQSLFAQDPDSGVWLRARIDHLPDASEAQTVIVDLKTAASADPRDFSRSAAEFGYDIQGEFYQRVLTLARGDADTSFRFIVVEKSAPYLVSVIELDALFTAIGKLRMQRAIETYKKCRDANDWPGYESITHLVPPPNWLAYEEEMVVV